VGGARAVGANEQSALVVEVAERPLDDPAVAAEARAVLGLAACDQRPDPARPEQPAVLVVVVAAVGDEPVRPPPGPATTAADRRDRVEQREQLRDIVATRWCRRPGQQQPAGVGQDVVLDACPAAADRAWAEAGAPFFACT
jgi:hypothetical protein